MTFENNDQQQNSKVELAFHPLDEEQYKWVRSTKGWIAGVCEAQAPRFGLPVVGLRILWVVLTVLSFGTGALLYLAFALGLPAQDQIAEAERYKVLGVCMRLSRKMNQEVGIVRAFTVFLLFASFGLTAFAYLVLNFVLPDEIQY